MEAAPIPLNEKQLLAVLNLSKTATAVHIGEQAVILFANDAMLSIWGKDRSVINKTLEDALPELKGQPFIDMFAKVWREGLVISGTNTPADLMVDGHLQTFYFDFEYRAIKDENGKVSCILHSAIDVTGRFLHQKAISLVEEREQALMREQSLNEELAASNEELNSINEELTQSREELAALNEELESKVELRVRELKETSGRFKRLVEQSPVAIGVFKGKDLIIDILNEKMVEILGKGDKIIGLPLAVALPELKTQPFLKILDEVLSTGVPYYANEAKGFTTRNGQLVGGYFNIIYQPLQDGYGQTNSILQVVTEVTEQVKARLELQQTKEMMDMAIDAAKLGSWHIDPVTKALEYNATLANIYGHKGVEKMTYDQAIGQISEEYKEQVTQKIALAIADGGDYDVTFTQHRFDDGELIWIRSFGKVNVDAKGHAIFSGFVLDVTEAKKDEQRKDDFIGMVSHELKTPLTSLNGYIQLLQRKLGQSSNVFEANALSSAAKQVKRMGNMINGFLNVSRLESGKILLHRTVFSLDELVSEIISEAEIIDSGHKIDYKVCSKVEVYADREKIGSVVSNLLSNAIKYSPYAVSVSVACQTVGDVVQISVRDFGMGINAKDLGKLFDRYYRVDSGSQISGFGIGLYLSAEIVERHQGKIWVESELNKGSVFYFSLPIFKNS